MHQTRLELDPHTTWHRTTRFDPAAAQLADRHYSRQKPGSPQFAPPGRCLILVTTDYDAIWVTSQQRFSQHAWPGAWVCSLFRNESTTLSSTLITEAIATTIANWGPPPPAGIITFVDPAAIRHKRDPGRCFRKAGFNPIGLTTKRRRLVLHLPTQEHPCST